LKTRTREEHHAEMIKTLTGFLDLAKYDQSVITCGMMAVMSEFLGNFQGALRKTVRGIPEKATIDLPGIVDCQLQALRQCIKDLEDCKIKMTGESH
jgi:hypothetical protein